MSALGLNGSGSAGTHLDVVDGMNVLHRVHHHFADLDQREHSVKNKAFWGDLELAGNIERRMMLKSRGPRIEPGGPPELTRDLKDLIQVYCHMLHPLSCLLCVCTFCCTVYSDNKPFVQKGEKSIFRLS